MSDPNLAYNDVDDDGLDIDQLAETWERINVEQKAEKQRKAINEQKNTLPFSEAIAVEICERVSSGELLLDICASDNRMPTVRRVTQWLKTNSSFAALYRESIANRLNIFEEQIIQISDDAKNDFKDVFRNGKTMRVADGEAIARAKLRVETRLKHLRAFRPSLWGEQSTLNLKQNDQSELDNLSVEELDKKILDLEKKDNCVRREAA